MYTKKASCFIGEKPGTDDGFRRVYTQGVLGVFFFFFLVCLSERSVMYEDTPTPVSGKLTQFFF